ncbi:unnamed protein product, partial [Mesorhabditis belari]|uniref:Tudor domain-containing protein n=1 Tax=Mesorhabditis belari TaxID=2138241 RepID=A0AAF3E998_9BILA
MNVEVRKDVNGAETWWPMKAIDITNEGLLIIGDAGQGDIQKIPFSDVRLPAIPASTLAFTVGNEIEAFIQDKMWRRVKITAFESNFLIVDLGDGKTDAVEFNSKVVRTTDTYYKKLTKDSFFHERFKIPEEVVNYFKKMNLIANFTYGKFFAKIEDEHMVVYATEKDRIEHAKMRLDVLIEDEKDRMDQLQKQKVRKALNNTEEDASTYMNEFSEPPSLRNLAIGTDGSNMKQAKEFESVQDIEVTFCLDTLYIFLFLIGRRLFQPYRSNRDSQGTQLTESDKQSPVFKVYANDPEATQKARALLEERVSVPKELVGNSVDKSGAIQIKNNEPMKGWRQNANELQRRMYHSSNAPVFGGGAWGRRGSTKEEIVSPNDRLGFNAVKRVGYDQSGSRQINDEVRPGQHRFGDRGGHDAWGRRGSAKEETLKGEIVRRDDRFGFNVAGHGDHEQFEIRQNNDEAHRSHQHRFGDRRGHGYGYRRNDEFRQSGRGGFRNDRGNQFC